MEMRNNELKFLANLAKQRLMNKDYSEKVVTSKNKASNYFIQNALALKKLKAETNYHLIISRRVPCCVQNPLILKLVV